MFNKTFIIYSHFVALAVAGPVCAADESDSFSHNLRTAVFLRWPKSCLVLKTAFRRIF